MSIKSSRFDVISKLFIGVKQGNQTLDQVKTNLSILKYFLTEKELEAFAQKFPDLDINEVKEFLIQVDGLKTAKKAVSEKGERVSKTSLNTAEAAAERGVKPEDVATYIEHVNAIYALAKALNKLVTQARVSFAIPVLKPKTEEVKTEEVKTEG